MYPAGQQVEFAAVVQQSHRQVGSLIGQCKAWGDWSDQRDKIGLEEPGNTVCVNARSGHILQVPASPSVLQEQRQSADGHDSVAERSQDP
jgi:hypothetical protein